MLADNDAAWCGSIAGGLASMKRGNATIYMIHWYGQRELGVGVHHWVLGKEETSTGVHQLLGQQQLGIGVHREQ